MKHDPLEIARLISGYIHQTLSKEEEKVFLELKNKDDHIRSLLESYKETAAIEHRLVAMKERDATAAWERFKGKKIKRRKTPWKRWLVTAAAVSLLFVGVWYKKDDDKIVPDKSHRYANDVLPGGNQARLLLSDGKAISLTDASVLLNEKNGTRMKGKDGELVYDTKSNENNMEGLFNTLEVPKGGTYKISLADGTRVWINASSSLRFPVNFTSNERRVKLKGEAYFEVAKDRSRPFKVEVDDTEITVLGTSFNVSNYTGSNVTTLVEGAVRVKRAEQQNYLKPGEQATLSNGKIKIGSADVEKAIAWKDGYFLFNEDHLKPILEEVARWYDLELVFKKEIPDIHIGGSMSRKENLSEVLEMLKEVSGLSFNIDGRKLMIDSETPN